MEMDKSLSRIRIQKITHQSSNNSKKVSQQSSKRSRKEIEMEENIKEIMDLQ